MQFYSGGALSSTSCLYLLNASGLLVCKVIAASQVANISSNVGKYLLEDKILWGRNKCNDLKNGQSVACFFAAFCRAHSDSGMASRYHSTALPAATVWVCT